MTPEGIRIPVRLTHTLLADLVARGRPSVTTAFTQLERDGHLIRHDNEIVLQGEPLSDFHALATTLHDDH